MARKWNRSRTAPDMGWIVGTFGFSVTKSDEDEVTTEALFDFADVDADALTGRIEQDKSDWFVKRVIMDVYAAVSFDNTTPTDTARLWSMAIGIAGNEDAATIAVQNYGVYSPEATNLYARTFRTYTRPVYASALIPYTNADFRIATQTDVVNSYGVTSTPWGPAMIRDDFEVSNAGLRNNQSCIIQLAQTPGPAGFDWDNLDTLYVQGQYRVLMQKRRT